MQWAETKRIPERRMYPVYLEYTVSTCLRDGWLVFFVCTPYSGCYVWWHAVHMYVQDAGVHSRLFPACSNLVRILEARVDTILQLQYTERSTQSVCTVAK